MDRYGCLDLRFEENEKVATLEKIWTGMCVEICDLIENENLNTLEKSERTEIIGGFHLYGRNDIEDRGFVHHYASAKERFRCHPPYLTSEEE